MNMKEYSLGAIGSYVLFLCFVTHLCWTFPSNDFLAFQQLNNNAACIIASQKIEAPDFKFASQTTSTTTSTSLSSSLASLPMGTSSTTTTLPYPSPSPSAAA